MTQDLSAKNADMQRHLTTAKDRLTEHTQAVAKCALSDTDKMARDMYLKRLHVHLAVRLEWRGETVPPEYKVAAASGENSSKAASVPGPGMVSDQSGLVALKFPQFLRSFKFMTNFMQETFDNTNDEETLNKSRLMWARMMQVLIELSAALKHAAGELGKHVKFDVKGVETAAVRAAAKEKADDEKKAAACAKKDAQEGAKKIKEEVSSKTFFALSDDGYHRVHRIPNSMKELKEDVDFKKPFLVSENCIVQSWMADKLIVQVATSYGSRYMKQDATRHEGKHTQPLLPSQGREVTETMFEKLMVNHKDKIINLAEAGIYRIHSLFVGVDCRFLCA